MDLKLAKKLAEAFGPSGFEDEVADILIEELKDDYHYEKDGLGSVVFSKENESPDKLKVMIAGHMDEVGFIVKHITSDGFIKFHNLGGWWLKTLRSQRVLVKGKDEYHVGVIGSTPPHFLKNKGGDDDISSFFIDVGADSKEEVLEMGIELGSPIAPIPIFEELQDGKKILTKAWDDRSGTLMIAEILKELKNEDTPFNIFGAATVQEEVGTRGAITASNLIKPDIAIVLEGTPADDTPGLKSDLSQAHLSKGSQMRVFDPTMIGKPYLINEFKKIAEDKELDLQIAVRTSGGTDAKMIHLSNEGVPTVIMAVPVRYIHSHACIFAKKDYESAKEIILNFLRDKEAAERVKKGLKGK